MLSIFSRQTKTAADQKSSSADAPSTSKAPAPSVAASAPSSAPTSPAPPAVSKSPAPPAAAAEPPVVAAASAPAVAAAQSPVAASASAAEANVPVTAASAVPGAAEVRAASPDGDENRTAPRRPASAVPSITGLRISPHGADAVLINISETGLLAECSERLKPGSAVTAVFEGTFAPNSMEGRVARTAVSSMGKNGRLRYHVGIEFAKKLPLEPLAPAAIETPAPSLAAAAAPVAPAALVQPAPIVRNRW
jgi:PilZ domain